MTDVTVQLPAPITVTVQASPAQVVEVAAGIPAGQVDPALIQAVVAAALVDHIEAPEPHAAYDIDMPSLTLLFENGLA